MADTQQGTSTQGGYEFDAQQNDAIDVVGRGFKFVGIFLLVLGILRVIGAVDDALTHHWIPFVHNLFDGVLFVVVAKYMRAGGDAMDRVVKTQGNDIPNLMTGMALVARAMRVFGWALLAIFIVQLLYGLALLAARHFGVHLPVG